MNNIQVIQQRSGVVESTLKDATLPSNLSLLLRLSYLMKLKKLHY